MPQQDTRPYGNAQPIADAVSSAYHAVTHAFGSDGTEDTDEEKKKKQQGGADPGMVEEANQTYRDRAAKEAADKPKPANFMARSMAKKPAPAPAPATSAARNRYGSLNKKTKY